MVNEKINVKNAPVVKMAEKIIKEFIADYFDEETQSKIERIIKECEIYSIEKRNMFAASYNEITPSSSRAGTADEGVITLFGGVTNIDVDGFYDGRRENFELDQTLHTIIHEYAHIFRKNNSRGYERMFEEGMAENFAKMCLINSKTRRLSDKDKDKTFLQPTVFTAQTEKYELAEQQVASILHIFNQRGEENSLIGDYLWGDEELFKQKCIAVFGEKFKGYFDIAISANDQYYNDRKNLEMNSETRLVQLLSEYIKNNGFDLTSYVDAKHVVLFKRNSGTLEKAVMKAGPQEYIQGQEAAYYEIESRAKSRTKQEEEEIQYQHNQIKRTVEAKYSVKQKTPEEMYDIISDMVSQYFVKKYSNNVRNKIFLSEIKKIVPNLEQFAEEFAELSRLSNRSIAFLEECNLEEVSYEEIANSLHSNLQVYELKSLEREIERKEQELAEAKETERQYQERLQELKTLHHVKAHEKEFVIIKEKDQELQKELMNAENANKINSDNRNSKETEKFSLLNEQEEIEKKNIFTRFFKRNYIKNIINRVQTLDVEIHLDSVNSAKFRETMSDLRSQISANRQQLLDTSGLTIEKYAEKLHEYHEQRFSQQGLLEEMLQIQGKIQLLDIPEIENELEQLYEKENAYKQTPREEKKDKKEIDVEMLDER